MLTGQGTPSGTMPWYTKLIVMLTAIFSVPIFVIPGGMLTWGFEAEAERLMRRKRERRRRLKQASFCVCFEKRALAGGGSLLFTLIHTELRMFVSYVLTRTYYQW